MTPGRAFVEQNIPGLGQIDHNIDQILTHVPILIGGISGPGALGGFGNVAGGLTTVENALTGAEAYLGPNYQEIAPNVFRSADGLRQFRMNTNDLFGPSAHVHFESIAPNGRAILETSHVDIIDP